MKSIVWLVAGVGLWAMSGCGDPLDEAAPPDEAKAAGKRAGDFPTATYDFFKHMDMEMPEGGTASWRTWS